MQEAEYRALNYLSQSDLKLLDKDIREFYKLRILGIGEEEVLMPDHFLLGSLVDYGLLTPQLMAKTFHICSDDKVSPTIRTIIHTAWESYQRSNRTKVVAQLTDIETHLIEAANTVGYGKGKYTDSRIIGDCVKSGEDYFKEILAGQGKVLVNFNTFAQSQQIIKRLKNDPDIARRLTPQNQHEEVKTQLVLTGEIQGVKVKGMMDLVKFDHSAKIIWPDDIKTCRSILEFHKNYKDYGYYIQGAFYAELLKQNYPGYDIRPFTFIVADIDPGVHPELFIMSEEDMYGGAHGGPGRFGYIKGYQQLVEDYKWHQENNLWEHRRQYYENGFNRLNIFQ